MPPLEHINITVDTKNGAFTLPELNAVPDSFIMYPFNITLGGVKFDYITAAPVAQHTENGVTSYYFKTTGGLSPICSLNNREKPLAVSDSPKLKFTKISDTARIAVMSEKLSDDFYIIDGNIIFSDAAIYGDGERLYAEYKSGDYCIINGREIKLNAPACGTIVRLKKRKAFRAKHSRYLFSHARKEYYGMRADRLSLEEPVADCLLDFEFSGSSLQMYSQGELISDFFNIDGTHRISLKYFRQYLENGKTIDIITAPFTKQHKIYTEKRFPYNDAALRAVKLTAVYRKTIDLKK